MKILEYQQLPSIAVLMQPFPYFADPSTPVKQIRELMKSHNIRHIPIQQKGHIVGIISERDLPRISNAAVALPVDENIPARNIMTLDPYVVEINTPLTNVIFEITQRKIGVAIITSSGELVGMVSVIDICRAFGELLNQTYKCK